MRRNDEHYAPALIVIDSAGVRQLLPLFISRCFHSAARGGSKSRSAA